MRIALLTLAATLALPLAATADPISERQQLMRERGQIMRTLGPIAQGNADFDAEVVLAALEQLQANAQTLDVDVHFPPESAEGDTKALPAIWENFDEFRQVEAGFDAAVAAAVEAAPQDLDAFRAAFGPVAQSCGSCHERFRQ